MRLRTLGIACAAWLSLAQAALASPYSAVVGFGDSLSDTGNVYELFGGFYPPPPYYEGRFSNGPVWIEIMATELGLTPPAASQIGGTNNAWGGAETGNGLSDAFTPNIGLQINSFLGGNDLSGTELISVWGGGNDFLNGENNAADPVNNLHNHIAALAQAGGTTFVVPNLPPLGQLPSTKGTSDEAELDALALAFNALLAAELQELRSLFDVTIFEVDIHGTFEDILADPGAFGFTNVTDAAYNEGTGDVVPNPDEYLFWDSIHPTASAHALLGEYAASLIPEPSSLVMLLMVGVSILRRRKHSTSSSGRHH